MSTFVFLGPSLSLGRARSIVEAEFLPPVAMGDLYELVMTRAQSGDRVAIIDGVFEQVPAVWHKEVLFALTQGIHVYGASSMGALRAAELHSFGMIGVGQIFTAFSDGVLTDDDEVAMAHATGEQGYRPLSTPMVALRFALADLVSQGELTPLARDALIAHAKALYYADRSWGGTISHAKALAMSAETVALLRTKAREPDVKASDAVMLLELLAKTADDGVPFVASFELEQTAFWASLKFEMQPRVVAGSMVSVQDDHAVTMAIRSHSPHRRAVEEEAVLLQLALSRSQGWRPNRDWLQRAAVMIAHRHSCTTNQALAAWRARQGLDDHDWARLLDVEARILRLLSQLRPELVSLLTPAAQRVGVYDEIAGELWQNESARRYDQAASQDSAIDPAILQSWYTARCGPMLPDPEAHALELGFPTLRDFVVAISSTFRATNSEVPDDD